MEQIVQSRSTDKQESNLAIYNIDSTIYNISFMYI